MSTLLDVFDSKNTSGSEDHFSGIFLPTGFNPIATNSRIAGPESASANSRKDMRPVSGPQLP